ncbi:MAG TPA: hypothetical protein PKD09_11415 [Aggregatilinea sp.]|uniref:hypothetical protein n=1 Tax=Aggregatilinea sp. TaxID=2806333 RepID=UPI002C1D8F1D|nr:hypothetical protein [Aggregatilinea sp.]HML22249.1 hypothetical protein [Aggregatilinea sp.]
MPLADVLVRLFVALFGIAISLGAGFSAVRTFVLPRSTRDPIMRFVFVRLYSLFYAAERRVTSYEWRDRIAAMYAPIGLLALPAIWIALITVGYTCVYWAIGVRPIYDAFTLSGSSLLTLGFERADGFGVMAISFSEATVGLMQIALIISYLPTMYSAFSKREENVSLLTVRAGSPPTALELLLRYNRIHGIEQLNAVWPTWEVWFADLEESHSSLAPLMFFRSPSADRSWITAAGTILDAASLYSSTLDLPPNPRADLCIRAGYIALRTIADFFEIKYNPAPNPGDPISIRREEFDQVYDELAASLLPVRPDREAAWRNYAGWRVNYDTALLGLAERLQAPYAPWTSDRGVADGLFPSRAKIDPTLE